MTFHSLSKLIKHRLLGPTSQKQDRFSYIQYEMVQPLTPPANKFVATVRKVYNPVGFQKGYNFVSWFIFTGALMGFTLARIQYLNISGVFCNPDSPQNASLGECYYYQNFDRYKIGIRLHLFCILPAAFLTCWQFTPVIRHKFMLFHRMNGYVIILLALISNIGSLMIARRAFGGGLDTQAFLGTLALMFTTSLVISYINIKRLQIDQHRAWMLRAWFYAGSIITLRLIFVISGLIISSQGDYTYVEPCDKLASFMNTTDLTSLYPSCLAFTNGTNLSAQTIVTADLSGNNAEFATATNIVFGMSGWIALALHAIGVEVYLHLTPRESARLRTVSYQRQLEAGYKYAGYAGLTSQRLGDADAFTIPITRARAERVPSESTLEMNPAKDVGGNQEGLVPSTTVRPAVSPVPSEDEMGRRIV